MKPANTEAAIGPQKQFLGAVLCIDDDPDFSSAILERTVNTLTTSVELVEGSVRRSSINE